MKFSTTFTLATLASLSNGTHARIGGEKYEIFVRNSCLNDVNARDARDQSMNQKSHVIKASSCKLWDSGTTESLQAFSFTDTQSNKFGTDNVQCEKKHNNYECQQFMKQKKLPDNACVITVPASMCDEGKMPPLPPPVTPPPVTPAPTLMPLYSGVMPYTVFVANTKIRTTIQAGLIDYNDDNPMSYNDVKGGECVKIGENVYQDAPTYFTMNPKDGSGGLIVDEVADCEYIGNSNNHACDLPNLPENACVILV